MCKSKNITLNVTCSVDNELSHDANELSFCNALVPAVHVRVLMTPGQKIHHLQSLPPTEQQHFFALSQSAQHGSTKSALGIWASNAYATDLPGETGMCSSVFAHACRLNHDCRPNAHAAWNDRIGMQTVHALREIRKGEEVLVAYIGGDEDGTRAVRQKQLQSKFSFTCECAQCGLTGASPSW